MRPTQHTMVSGETLSGIAQQYGVTLGELIKANPFLKEKGRSPNLLYPDERISIPAPTFQADKDTKTGTILCPDRHWVELEYLYEEDGTPVADMPFVCQLSDGSQRNGRLDSNGFYRIDNIPPGSVTVEYGDPEEEAELNRLRNQLREALDAMVAEVAQEAAFMEAELQKQNLLQRGVIYTGAFLTGLYEEGKGMVTFAWDTVVTIAKIDYTIRAKIYRALRDGSLDAIRRDMEELVALGGEVREQLQEAHDAIELILEDPPSRALILNFPERYFSSLHDTEKTRMLGGLSFDIVLALLAAGAGAAALAFGKSRYFKKAASLIQDMVKLLKRRKLRKNSSGRADKRIDTKTEKSGYQLKQNKSIELGANRGFDAANLESKLADYLLNPSHPQNQSKAIWFDQALGFNQSNWEKLGNQLVFDESKAVVTKTTTYGTHYEQMIPITGTNGRVIDVPFVFMKDKNGVVRLVTGVPPKR